MRVATLLGDNAPHYRGVTTEVTSLIFTLRRHSLYSATAWSGWSNDNLMGVNEWT